MYNIDIQTFIKSKYLSQKQFSELTGIDTYQISRLVNGKLHLTELHIQKIKAVFPDFNPKYVSDIKEFDNNLIAGEPLPVYGTEVYGTISPVFEENEILLPIAIKKIPHFSKADGAVQVRGHSMKGYINNGDWIVIKKITNRNLIIYGEPYLVITKSDNYRTVKFLKESMDDPKCLTLVPYNIEQFEPQDIEKNEILELYSILALFRHM